ncbi:MAG: ComF family protein [Candidatus Moranbacteria bacterium]|jgi:ComF family protein|nr:ComF family protein [Candidatus Moranbacteria bacterium]MBP9801769.1 ComF family protein [Candidatus Moranbacteria bacterium]
MKPRYEQRCPYCRQHITPHGETCFACSSKKALEGMFVSYDYEQPLVKTTLHAFKYHSLESLAHPLSQLFIQTVSSSGLPLPDCIIPVPLHPWKLRYRGFNQSEFLGQALSVTLLPGISIPFYTDNLLRHRFTLPQQKMPDVASRKNNVKNAFSVPKHTSVLMKEKTIWLIDDIATTASTLDACAHALRQAGARKVFGVVFAQKKFVPNKNLSSRKNSTEKTS